MAFLLAADTGGTFTDVVVHDSISRRTEFGKRLTDYNDLVAGVIDSLQDTTAKLSDAQLLKHGTTHVINAFIQRTGSTTALITTRGFRDILEIARGNRAVPFDLGYRRPQRGNPEVPCDRAAISARPAVTITEVLETAADERAW